MLAKLTVDETTGSGLDTKADGVSEPESEPESGEKPETEAVVGSGGYKSFATTTTVFFILSLKMKYSQS